MRVEHGRAQHARVDADEQHRQREPRHEQVREPLPRVLGQRDVAAEREQLRTCSRGSRASSRRGRTPAWRRRSAPARSARGRGSRPAEIALSTPNRIPRPSQMIPAPIASESVAGRSRLISSQHVDLLRVGDDLAREDLVHRREVLDVDRLVEAPLRRARRRPAAASPGGPRAAARGRRSGSPGRSGRSGPRSRTARAITETSRRTTKRPMLSARCAPSRAGRGRRARRRRRR